MERGGGELMGGRLFVGSVRYESGDEGDDRPARRDCREAAERPARHSGGYRQFVHAGKRSHRPLARVPHRGGRRPL
jgi:hypothetical protein